MIFQCSAEAWRELTVVGLPAGIQEFRCLKRLVPQDSQCCFHLRLEGAAGVFDCGSMAASCREYGNAELQLGPLLRCAELELGVPGISETHAQAQGHVATGEGRHIFEE